MDAFIFQLSEFAQLVFETTWLPLVIWTVISFGVWFFLQMFENVHPIYQYHTRLALIFSLPAGLLSLASIHYISNWITASAGEGLTMITVISPIDISFTQVEESSGIPFMVIVQSLAVAIFLSGMIFFLIRFCMHAINLKKLRKSLNYQPISEVTSLSPENRGLALATGKNVQVAFLNSEIIPVTFGFRKPVILLPHSLKNQPEKLNLALRHELTHITQHDFFSHLMVILTEAVFWFHPLVHLLKRELVEYREMRCDNIVLSEASVSRKEYASLLLELIPMPNLNKELSVNMAQESSNLKKRITMITQQTKTQQIPKWSSLLLLGIVFLTTAFAMACTDMQTQQIFDEEELDLMTLPDRNGDRGYHQILIILGEEGQTEKHADALQRLKSLRGPIYSIKTLSGEDAVSQFGDRARHGAIRINTRIDAESYNTVLRALGMNPVAPESLTPQNSESSPQDDFFVVVEEMPELIGGLASIQEQIQYPEMARRAGIEGRVYVQFIVDENGDVVDPKIIRGIGGGADEEALRVVSKAKFNPGMQRGQPVRVQYSLPIMFKLGNEENGNVESSSGGSAQVESPATMEKRMIVEVNNDDGKINGTVLDGETRQPLAGANITLAGSNVGASSDMNGNFSIDADGSGEYELIFSYIGYEKASLSITR